MNTTPPAPFTMTANLLSRVFLQPNSSSYTQIPSFTRSPSLLPLYLDCLGGRWKGSFISWGKEHVQIRIKGLPPIERSQNIQLQYVNQHDVRLPLLLKGTIEDIRLESGSSPWERMTNMLLKCDGGHEGTTQFFSRINPGPVGKLEGVFYGSVGTSPPSVWTTLHTPTQSFPPSPVSLVLHQKTTPQEIPFPSQISDICSTRLTIEKNNGQRISAYYDRRIDEESSVLPVVVMAPGYGETKRDFLTLAYFFARNGFQVVRYDHTNHVGESDGVHYEVSLSSMKEDFHTVTGFVKKTWPHALPIGVASSLALRAVLKAETEYSSVSLLVMLMGIVNVQRSAATVHQEDLFAGYCRGQYPDSANFLGFNVGNQFLRDALANKFVTLEETLNDAEQLSCPLIGVSGGKDAWVAPDDLQAFRKTLGNRVQRWIEVPDALHRLQENPKIARAVYREVVTSCLQLATGNSSHRTIHSPSRLELGRQNREEKIALQGQAETKVGPAFWQDYLSNFQSIDKCPDYLKLLDHLFHALGTMTPGQRILDAGCGNGNTGIYFLHTLRSESSYRNFLAPDKDGSIQYVGTDIIPEALQRATRNMMLALSELQQHSSLSSSLIKANWAQIDLNHPLPFPDNHFNRIVSNLVLGYVRDPRAALKELYRVLAPGGRMVITNLKPDGDFSGIYQSLVDSTVLPQQREEARELLNNYGKIRQAEKEGQFCFYHRTQWESIAADLGCKHVKIYPTFAGQAYLLILEKPAVGGQISSPVLSPDRSSKPDPTSDFLKQVA